MLIPLIYNLLLPKALHDMITCSGIQCKLKSVGTLAVANQHSNIRPAYLAKVHSMILKGMSVVVL